MFACFYICLNGPIQQSPAIGLTARTMYCTSLSCICLVGASLADSMRYQSFLQYRILPRFTVPALSPGRSLLLWVCFRRGGSCPSCWRVYSRCSGSRGAFGQSRTSSARRHPSTVYHSLCPGARSSPPSFPGGLAKVTARGNHTARAAPPVLGARPSCLNCSIFRAHGAYFPVITRTTS